VLVCLIFRCCFLLSVPVQVIVRSAVSVNFASIKHDLWANAHETRDSISLISYAGCLGLSPVISAKIHSKCASQPEIAKNSLKPIFSVLGVQGRSRSSMLVPPDSSSAVLVMISNKSVSIRNRSHARLANIGIN